LPLKLAAKYSIENPPKLMTTQTNAIQTKKASALSRAAFSGAIVVAVIVHPPCPLVREG
jgi:hypothetical protein